MAPQRELTKAQHVLDDPERRLDGLLVQPILRAPGVAVQLRPHRLDPGLHRPGRGTEIPPSQRLGSGESSVSNVRAGRVCATFARNA